LADSCDSDGARQGVRVDARQRLRHLYTVYSAQQHTQILLLLLLLLLLLSCTSASTAPAPAACCLMSATGGSTCGALACASSARPLGTGTAQLVLNHFLTVLLPLLATLAAARGPMALALRSVYEYYYN
jgi:hypothetical protein